MTSKRHLLALFPLLITLGAMADEPWLSDFEEAARLAARGNSEEALPALGRAIQAGLEDPSIPLADSRMESIKHLPAFKRVIRSMARSEPLLHRGPR